MSCRTVTVRRHANLARISLNVGDELGNCLHWYRWMDLHDKRRTGDAGDSSNIADEIETKLIVEGRVDRVAVEDQKERIAVQLRPHDHLGANIAARTRSIVDYELLAEPLRELLSDQTSHGVGRTARRVADDDTHGPRRVGLRPSDARHSRERGSARGQVEKLSSVGKFHLNPPSLARYVFAPPGRRTVNTEPFPGSLVTVTSPPIMRASLRERARPSPVPPKR